MELQTVVHFITKPVFVFFFTLFFAYLPRLFNKTMISTYTKCLTGGIILSIMILHIFPDLYESSNNMMGPNAAGISFLILFSIDKLYLDRVSEVNDCVPKNTSDFQALIFVFALSLHSFFEGVSIPVKTDSMLKWYALSLLGHKWIEAFSLGMSIELSNLQYTTKQFLLFIYSVLTPLGSLFGSFCTSFNEKNEVKLISDILVGISTGSFFYIGFIEMLNSEFNKEDSKNLRVKKIFIILLGYSAMTILLFVLGK